MRVSTAVLLACFLCIGCSKPQTPPTDTLNSGLQFPGLPPVPVADVARGTLGVTDGNAIVLLGDQVYGSIASADIRVTDGTLGLDTDLELGLMSWAIYQFSGLSGGQQPQSFSIHHRASGQPGSAPSAQLYLAYADYSSGSWRFSPNTTAITADVEIEPSVNVAAPSDAVSSAGNAYLLVLLYGAGDAPLLADRATAILDGAATGVPPQRLVRLSRGIDNFRPFWSILNYNGGYSDAYVEQVFGEEQIAYLGGLGFRHVRLPFHESVLYDFDNPATPYAGPLAQYLLTVDRLIAQDIAVVVDFHPLDWLKDLMGTDQGFRDEVSIFWGALATALSDRDPDYVFFEIMNEPTYVLNVDEGIFDYATWDSIQLQLHSAIRSAAPEHTIIATGPGWSSPQALTQITLLDDPNVVYTFHFYHPFHFTHQGAAWVGEPWQSYHDLPWPSTPENIEPFLAEFTYGSDPYWILWSYGDARENRVSLEAVIGEAAAWGRLNSVPIYCGEFGVYQPNSPAADRLAWHQAVREILEDNYIGWAKWDYDEDFGIIEYNGPAGDLSQTTPDTATLGALGLSPKQAKLSPRGSY